MKFKIQTKEKEFIIDNLYVIENLLMKGQVGDIIKISILENNEKSNLLIDNYWPGWPNS